MCARMLNAQKKKFYITNAIPYVNAQPHIGHAFEYVQTDVIARYHRLQGERVLVLCGSDDNALKNVQAAERAGVDPRVFIETNTESFRSLAVKLNVQFDIFQKGSDEEHHFPSSQRLWERCAAAGDIYKRAYEGLYCVGCEAFYALGELNEAGECFEHPGRALERVAEENYFFRLSRYHSELTELISSGELAIFPGTRKNEMLSFLGEPLQDISISRSNQRARNWGVPVPGDNTQRMYVWFDALNIYQSGIGFGWSEQEYQRWWPADLHVIGKGITRFHAIYWPAFLLSAKLALPKALFVHGYLTVDGEKMSKSIGNSVDPFELVETWGADPLRYYFLREIPANADGDFSRARLRDRYNGDLANGLGNLVSRVATLGARISPLVLGRPTSTAIADEINAASAVYERAFQSLQLHEAIAAVWRLIGFTDRYISETKPWAEKDVERFRDILWDAGMLVTTITRLIGPFLPESAERISRQIWVDDTAMVMSKGESLFPRFRE